nr:FtsX-like permease family protein [Saprospiraceae bacterium]
WLGLQDINETIILQLMILVAIINMITVLLILILERTQMIGVLKSLGMNNWRVRKIFIYNAGYIVFFGLILGNILGLGIAFLQKHFQFIKLDEANYYLSTAPIEINFITILMLNIGTFVVTLIFLVLPTMLVTRITPIKALRFE